MPAQQEQWGQQLPPPYGQPFYRQPLYRISPSPDFGRSRLWLWIILAVLGSSVALSCVGSTIFVALNLANPGIRTGLLLLLFFLFVVIVPTLLKSIVDDYILEHGDLVEGRVIKHHTGCDEDGTHYYLTYTYEYGGETYSKEHVVRKKTYREIPDGTRIRVRCLPKNPQRARIVERWWYV